MTHPRIIIGAGGHAKVLIEALLLSRTQVAGILDPNPETHGKRVLGVPVIGNDDVLFRYDPAEVRCVNGIGSVRVPRHRCEVFLRLLGKGYSFVSVIHPSAVIASDAVIGEGAQIMAGVVIQPGCVIGRNTIINTRASVDHDCVIGDHAHIAPGVTLSGEVRIGEGAHIGTAATVIQGVQIGSNSLIGAGALVIRDVPSHAKVMGVPAKEV